MGSVLTTQELFGSSSKVRKDYSIDQVFEETAKDEDFRSKRYRIPGEQHDTISYGHLIPNKQEYYDLASDLGIKDPENLEEAEGLSLLKHDFSVRRDEIGRKYRTTSHALLDIMANKKMQYSPSGFERRFGEGLRKSNPSILADALNKESTEKDKEGFRGIRNRNNIVIENLESYTMDLQENLSKKGHDSGKIDGKFGPKTKDAVKEFQQEKGLSADGFPGANTIKELFGKLNIFKVGTAEAGGSKNQTLTTEELFGSKELLTTEELFKDPIVPDPEKPSVAKIFGENFIKGASVLVGETSKGLLAGIQSIPTGVGGLLDILGQNIKIDKESGEKLKEKGLVDDEYIDRMEKIGGTLSLWGKTSKDFWQKASREGIAKSDPKIFQGSFMQNPSWTRATSIVAGAIPSLGAATVASMATGNPMTGLAFLGMLEAEPIHAGAIKAGEP